MNKLVFLCLILCNLKFSLSCSCLAINYDTAEDLVKNYGEIFVGTAKNIIEKESTREIQFSVEKVYFSDKDLEKNDNIIVSTCSNSACCGLSFELNVQYVVFVNNSSSEIREVSLCTPTQKLENAEKHVILLEDYMQRNNSIILRATLILMITIISILM